ncbi:MAG: SCO family protein [Burkholderiales bacterium]
MMRRGSDVARLPLEGSRRVRMTRLTAWVCALLALLIAAPALGALDTFDTKRALRESQAAIGHRPGDYRFTDTEGKTVRLSAYRGKPLVVSFVYTGCFQVCPTTTKHLETMVRQAERAARAPSASRPSGSTCRSTAPRRCATSRASRVCAIRTGRSCRPRRAASMRCSPISVS